MQPCFSSGTSVPPFEISLSPLRVPVGAMSTRPAPPPIPVEAFAGVAPATYDETSLVSAIREDGFMPLPTSTSTVDGRKSACEPLYTNETTTIPDGEDEGVAAAPPSRRLTLWVSNGNTSFATPWLRRLTCTGENSSGMSSDE